MSQIFATFPNSEFEWYTQELIYIYIYIYMIYSGVNSKFAHNTSNNKGESSKFKKWTKENGNKKYLKIEN